MKNPRAKPEVQPREPERPMGEYAGSPYVNSFHRINLKSAAEELRKIQEARLKRVSDKIQSIES